MQKEAVMEVLISNIFDLLSETERAKESFQKLIGFWALGVVCAAAFYTVC